MDITSIDTDQICLKNIDPNKKLRKVNKKNYCKLNNESVKLDNKSPGNQSNNELYEEINETIESQICLNDKAETDESEKIPEMKRVRKRLRKNRILKIKQTNKIKSKSNIENKKRFNEQTNGLNVPKLNFDDIFRTSDDEITEKKDTEIIPEKDDIEMTSEKEDSEIISKKDDNEITPEKEDSEIISKKDDNEITPEKEDIELTSENNSKNDSENDDLETKSDCNEEKIENETRNEFKNSEEEAKDNKRKKTRKKRSISKSESFIKNGKEFLSRSMNTRAKDSDPKRMFACFDTDSSLDSNYDSDSEKNKKSSDEDEPSFENLSKKDFYRESQKLFKNFGHLNESSRRRKEQSSTFGVKFISILIFCYLIYQIPGFKNVFN